MGLRFGFGLWSGSGLGLLVGLVRSGKKLLCRLRVGVRVRVRVRVTGLLRRERRAKRRLRHLRVSARTTVPNRQDDL